MICEKIEISHSIMMDVYTDIIDKLTVIMLKRMTHLHLEIILKFLKKIHKTRTPVNARININVEDTTIQPLTTHQYK